MLKDLFLWSRKSSVEECVCFFDVGRRAVFKSVFYFGSERKELKSLCLRCVKYSVPVVVVVAAAAAVT